MILLYLTSVRYFFKIETTILLLSNDFFSTAFITRKVDIDDAKTLRKL